MLIQPYLLQGHDDLNHHLLKMLLFGREERLVEAEIEKGKVDSASRVRTMFVYHSFVLRWEDWHEQQYQLQLELGFRI